MSGYGKIYESSYWGVGVCDNTIGWGSSYKSIANCTDASFIYPLDSYPTNGTDPTPTITGDAGGTFTATPSGLSLNASTGEITLSTSTVNSYTIRYTLPDTTFAEQSMQITAPPFSSTRSFSFDGVDSYFDLNDNNIINSASSVSFSFWVNVTTAGLYDGILCTRNGSDYILIFLDNVSGSNFKIKIQQNSTSGGSFTLTSSPTLTAGNWYNVIFTGTVGGKWDLYINGDNTGQVQGANNITAITQSSNFLLGSDTLLAGRYLNGLIDEVAIWNSTALSSTAVTEIYNSGVPNDLDELTNASDPSVWYRCGE